MEEGGLWGARGATGPTVRAVLTGPQPQCIGTPRQVGTDRLTERRFCLGLRGGRSSHLAPPKPTPTPAAPPLCTSQLSSAKA